MIIDLSKSKLFTTDPSVRFAREYAVPEETWKELWRRYKLLDYSNGDLRDFLFVKHARSLSYNSMERWIRCGEIYMLSKPVIDKGAHVVNSVLFGEQEQYVIDILTKQLRFGRSGDTKAII